MQKRMLSTGQNISIEQISEKSFLNEEQAVKNLLEESTIYQERSKQIFTRAEKYVEGIREVDDSLSVESFLHQYSLSTYEGVAIMCLAEALLRIPDSKTADELIEEKLSQGDWKKHFADDANILLNASTFGLMVSGKIISIQKSKSEITHAIGGVAARISEPLIREALKTAMKILGKKFVLGTTTSDALKKAEKIGEKGYLFSFDMLGEGARTAEQAEHFFNSYINGIKQIGVHYAKKSSQNNSSQNKKFIYHNPNVSVKLSALHPRYEMLNKERVLSELLPKLKQIVSTAIENNIWIAIDAEEANRLEISLILFTELLKQKEFYGFNGLGFVVQAYQKRAPFVIDYLKQLAEETGRIIPVRLVKGAYWDSEVKHAQMHGLSDYPVYTRKAHTDLSYLICAKKLLQNLKYFYPQFATHNALTVASILEISDDVATADDFEFQRLFGMGDAFYDEMVKSRPVRIYAPIGSYEELLPYLIRRILENGANTSFVNLVVNKNEPIGQILTNPIDKIIRNSYFQTEGLPSPQNIFAPERKNSAGKDFGYSVHLNQLQNYLNNFEINKIKLPANNQSIDDLILNGQKYFPKWRDLKTEIRAGYLNNLADLLEQNENTILPLLMVEANKTANDAISELREAVDFCRYYAAQAIKKFAKAKICKGYTGEKSLLHYKGKGLFFCVSPWNFPLAIFIGQVAAALVSGNTVIAKPAPQTEKIAAFTVKLAHEAGVPKQVLQLFLNQSAQQGAIDAQQIIANPNIAGVVFTGSTAVAQKINATLATRKNAPIATLIAETGGQNCMIIDSSTLLERAVDDAINSAFGSAGQRCSALRVLYIQAEVYDATIKLLEGALEQLKIGVPAYDLSVDVPPVIDESSKKKLQTHIKNMNAQAKIIAKAEFDSNSNISPNSNFVLPHIFEIENISQLSGENFGPILHVIKYKKKKISDVIEQINSTGFALTFGIHSRLEGFIADVTSQINAGNIYINRSQIGAVVGTHPFGGYGLSGTGPKAGGPNYLRRFVNEVTVTSNTAAIGGNLELIG